MKCLKKQLYNLIKEKGILSYDELEHICHIEFYRVGTATRRLRELCENEDSSIVPIMNGKYITAWKWKQKPI